MIKPVLFDYWRSSASHRVRIALNLLGLNDEAKPVVLLKEAHRADDYLARNPKGLLPMLEIDGTQLTQSLAIIEYLHATREGLTLLPSNPMGQDRVRQLSFAATMEIHPVCNLGVAAHVIGITQGSDAAKVAWMGHFIEPGLAACEALLAQGPGTAFCNGNGPTRVDCCLIPQRYNTDRWGLGFFRVRQYQPGRCQRCGSSCLPNCRS